MYPESIVDFSKRSDATVVSYWLFHCYLLNDNATITSKCEAEVAVRNVSEASELLPLVYLSAKRVRQIIKKLEGEEDLQAKFKLTLSSSTTSCLGTCYLLLAYTYSVFASEGMMKSNLSDYLIEMVSDDIYYDEANPKYRCVWNKFHVLAFCTIIVIFFGISVFAVCFVDYHSFLVFIGRTDVNTLAGKIGLIIFTKLVVISIAVFFVWQCRVVSSCRQFFHDKQEQKRYMHTAIPENLPAVIVKPPEITGVHKLTPEYLPFTLE
uniref:DUF1084 domain-containing protein n=1 Tax=Syphacia muris TaxID=451379 RepID=A0A0N5ARR2_9BILA